MIGSVSAAGSAPASPVALAAVFGPPGILLIRRELEPFKALWGLPGGKVHYGEHLDQAVEREVYEESGLRSRFVELRGVVTELLVRPTRTDLHYLLLVCWLTAVRTRVRSSAEGEVRWFGATELARMRSALIPSDLAILEHLVFRRPSRFYFRCRVLETTTGYQLKTFR
jgi:8-oxo-dGTP diphosphatase